MMRDTGEARMALRSAMVALAALGLDGCATASRLADAAAHPLDAIGLGSATAVPDAAGAPAELPRLPPARAHRIRLEIDAADNLNADAQGRGLALILRIYRLRDTTAFLQAPLETFLDAAREREALAGELVDVHELVLKPGQPFAAQELLDADASALGIVALYRHAAPYRWRLAFRADLAERTGIRIGAHACALSVTAGLDGNDGAGRPLVQLPPSCR